MAFSLQAKNAFVTGGGSGIGRAICRAFAEHGATVCVADLNPEAARAVAGEITTAGGSAVPLSVDVTDANAVTAAVARAFGGAAIDVLVNNAGIAHVGNVEATTGEDMDRLYAVNVKGVYHCIHACIPGMKGRGGVILNLASIASSVGIADRFAYSMTKGAVLTMTYSVARDYLAAGIRCNSISPARVHTPFVDKFISENYPGEERAVFARLSATQPIGRMGQPAEIAHLAVYLASDEAAFITGTDFPIDGGFIKLH